MSFYFCVSVLIHMCVFVTEKFWHLFILFIGYFDLFICKLAYSSHLLILLLDCLPFKIYS